MRITQTKPEYTIELTRGEVREAIARHIIVLLKEQGKKNVRRPSCRDIQSMAAKLPEFHKVEPFDLNYHESFIEVSW